ncbi:MAG: Gfo/Idh/MocA family oxidoreductase, partial [Thermomicrobiales bacterium]
MTVAKWPIEGRPVRVGVIGAGTWANHAHLPGWHRDSRCEIVAVCDSDAALADAAKATFGASAAYTDYRALIERDDIDVVDVV